MAIVVGGDHLHGGHADLMRHDEVLFEVVEHDGAGGIDALAGEEAIIGLAVRLGHIGHGADVVDILEQVVAAQPGQHGAGMAGIAIGEDEFAAGKVADGSHQLGMSCHRAIVDGVHGVEEMVGIDAMARHQSVQRGAEIPIVFLLQGPRGVEFELRHVHDIAGNAHIDLREEIAFARIEGVVEVEHPIGDVVEVFRRDRSSKGHGGSIAEKR